MSASAEAAKDPFGAPVWWIRLLVFLALNLGAGICMLFSSPGGGVQTTGTQIQSILVTPIYAPIAAAFLFGAALHSFVILIAAAVIGCPAALVLTIYYFSTKAIETWYVCLALLMVELLLAWAGQAVFISNMKGWT
jgi:hypothetical protein